MYLGIDIGTSSVKVGADRRAISASSRRGASRSTSSARIPGWSEQDPESWVAATSSAIDALCREHPAEIEARARHRPFRPHAWRDADRQGRPAAPPLHPVERRALGRGGGGARRRSALPRDHRQHRLLPASPRRSSSGCTGTSRRSSATSPRCCCRRIIVRLWLTGDYASDMSDSAGTSWLDVAKRDWSDELLAATHLDRDQMPALYRGHGGRPASFAPCSRAAGACASAPVVAGGARRQCRVRLRRRHGRAGLCLRLARHVRRALRRPTTNSGRTPASAVHAFCHALPNTWHQMGVILSAAASLEWLAGVTRRERRRARPTSVGAARRRGAALLPPLPLRRAHAAQRRRRARQLRRARRTRPTAPRSPAP